MPTPAVFPGDFVAHEEEFAAGESTFADAGNVYALRDGKKNADASAHLVSVLARKNTRKAKPGDIAFGRVRDLYQAMAGIEVEAQTWPGEIPSIGEKVVFCRISEIQRGFLEDFREALRVGDFVRVRFDEFKRLAAYVTMKDPDLGVIRAWCSKCRTEMKLSRDGGECPYCGNREPRKVAEFEWKNLAVKTEARPRPPRRERSFGGDRNSGGSDRPPFGGHGNRPERRG